MTDVLIVDAEAQTRQEFRLWLEAEGVTVVEAANTDQALEVVKAQGAPAVTFCSIQLAPEDGIWLASHFRDAHPQTAVVMTTSVHDLDLAVRSLQAGVVDYLTKPVARVRLAESLMRARLVYESRHALVVMQTELEKHRARVTEALAELELNASIGVKALLAMRRPHDPRALERARRIAALTVNLGLILGIREPALSRLERAVYLAPSYPPQPEELKTLAALRKVPMLADAVEIASAAQERYDGSGLPHGFVGDQIPLGARIIAVATAYDELVSPPGGTSMSAAAAVERLCTWASLFDRRVLDALKTLQPAAPEQPSLESAPTVAGPFTSPAGAPADPRRRWPRRPVPRLPSRIGGNLARIVDISYGGFRLESPLWLDATPEASFVLDIPTFDLSTGALWAWTKPLAGGGYSYGAFVPSDEAIEGSRWRAFVDTLSQTL
ncbi:MAG: response regulator [Acidobacteria bacterium]|nr:response regulator [Acidobacteriota bacterium]